MAKFAVLKFKKQRLAAISTERSLTQTALQEEACTEFSAYTVSATGASPCKEVLGILLQPIGLRLHPCNQTWTPLANKKRSILTSQDSAF